MNKEQMFQTALKHQNQPGLAGPERSDGHDIPGAVWSRQEKERGCPEPACSQAGGSPQATGPTPLDWVILSNPRAKRELDFLVQTVGEEKLIAAKRLLGTRKAFPLNLAHILRVKLPERLQFMPADEAKEKIQDLRRLIRARGDNASLVPDPTPPFGVRDGH